MTILRCSIERWTRRTGRARLLGFMMRKGLRGEFEGTRQFGGAYMGPSHSRHRIRGSCLDRAYQTALTTTFESIKNYQLKFYYNGQWKPEYDRWVSMLSGMSEGPGKERVAWNQALTSDMVYTQPVVHEFGNIRPATLLLIGQSDRTAPGANRAPAEVARRLGNYPELGRRAAKAIPNATLVEFAELVHSPQVEAPERF